MRARGAMVVAYRDVLLCFEFDDICELRWIPEVRVGVGVPLDASDDLVFMILGECPCVTGPSFSSMSSRTAIICHPLSHNYITHMCIYKLSRYIICSRCNARVLT